VGKVTAAPANNDVVKNIIKQIERGEARLGIELPSNLSEKDWVRIGSAIGKRRSELTWAVADWWAAGGTYSSRMRDAQKGLLGQYSMSTLRTYGMVARHVDRKIRTDKLSFWHHRVVYPLPVADQVRFLNKAIAERLTAPELREAVAQWEAQTGRAPKATYTASNGQTRAAKPADTIADFDRAVLLFSRRWQHIANYDEAERRFTLKTAAVVPVQLSLVALEPEPLNAT
jgi:hypothetical protein